MPKLKDLALGILVAPVLIPIMLIASYQDKKALKKNWSKKDPNPKRKISHDQNSETNRR